MDDALRHVEQCCILLQTDPQRASQQLVDLRSSPDALALGRYVLERSSIPAAQFHATSLLQAVALHRWVATPVEERVAMKAYLATFLLNNDHRLENFVSAQILQTFAVLWKRSWAEESLEAKKDLFAQLQMLAADPDRMTLASRFLLALVGEFSTSKSAALGLPLEFHRKVHEEFGTFGLQSTLELGIGLLVTVVKTILESPGGLMDAAMIRRADTIISLCTETLSWDFRGFDPLHDPTATTSITPPIAWRSIVVRSDLISAIFEVYCRFRRDPALSSRAHSVRQLLTQLASLTGPIFANTNEKVEYASFLFRGTMNLVCEALMEGIQAIERRDEMASEVYGQEVLSLCQLLKIGVRNFKVKVLAAFPFYNEFLDQMAKLSSELLKTTAATALRDGEGELYEPWTMEAFDELLCAWVSIVSDSSLGLLEQVDVLGGREADLTWAKDKVVECAAPLYTEYVLCKLTLGRIEAERGFQEDEEGEDYTEEDSHDQLQSVAYLGRLSPYASLHFIRELLKAEHQKGCFPRLEAVFTSSATSNTAAITTYASGLMEETRVVIQCYGHLVADDGEGERPVIPDPIHKECFKSDAFAALFIEVNQTVMMCVNFMLQRICQNPTNPLISPYLNESLLWCMTRWSKTYLIPGAELYRNNLVAPNILNAYGMHSNTCGGPSTVDALLQAAWTYLCHWPSEPDTCKNACLLLKALTSYQVYSCTVHLDTWRAILNSIESEAGLLDIKPGVQLPGEVGFLKLPADIRGLLLEVLASGILSRNEPTTPVYFNTLIRPMEAKLQRLMMILDAAGAGRNGRGMEADFVIGPQVGSIQALVECFAGLSRALDSTPQHLLAGFISSILERIIHIAGLCHAYPEVIFSVLGFLRDYAEVQTSSLTAPQTISLLHACAKILRIYSSQNLGRRRAEANADEEMYWDILCVLQLLTHVADKGFVDFDDEKEGKLAMSEVAEVVFYGLQLIIPLMNEELLKFPSLSKQFFTLITFMVDAYTDRLAQLDHSLFCQLLQAVMFGVQITDSAIARDSLRALAGLASYHFDALKDGTSLGLSVHIQQKGDLISSCMHKLLQMVVFESSIWDRLDACSNAILALIVCDREGFARMVNSILEQQEPVTRDRLRAAFENLVSAIPVDIRTDRHTRFAFRDKLKGFATSVRPFMQRR